MLLLGFFTWKGGGLNEWNGWALLNGLDVCCCSTCSTEVTKSPGWTHHDIAVVCSTSRHSSFADNFSRVQPHPPTRLLSSISNAENAQALKIVATYQTWMSNWASNAQLEKLCNAWHVCTLLQQVPKELKLTVLYLIDSILKNVQVQEADYKQQFAKNLVSNFCAVFQQVRLIPASWIFSWCGSSKKWFPSLHAPPQWNPVYLLPPPRNLSCVHEFPVSFRNGQCEQSQCKLLGIIWFSCWSCGDFCLLFKVIPKVVRFVSHAFCTHAQHSLRERLSALCPDYLPCSLLFVVTGKRQLVVRFEINSHKRCRPVYLRETLLSQSFTWNTCHHNRRYSGWL